MKKAITEDKHEFARLILDHGFEFDKDWVQSVLKEIQEVILKN